MPTFLFNVREGSVLIEGIEGQEFATIEDARHDAVDAAREMLAEKVRQGSELGSETIEVVDKAGVSVAQVSIAEQIRFK